MLLLYKNCFANRGDETQEILTVFAYLCPKSANVDVEPLGMLRTRRPDTWFNFLYAVIYIIIS